MNRKGYITLAEILTSVAIIGLLAALTVPSFLKAKEKRQHKEESGVTYYGSVVDIYIDGHRVEGKRVKLEITTK